MYSSWTSALAAGNVTWSTPSTGGAAFLDDGGVLPLPGLDAELVPRDAWSSWSRRHYWQALMLLSVGLSAMLGAFVFLLATTRHGRHGCSVGTAGAAAATLSSLLLVALLVCTRTLAVDTPKYA